MEKRINTYLYPEKSQYITGEEVWLKVGIGKKEENVTVQLRIFQMEKLVRTVSAVWQGNEMRISAGTFSERFKGFGAELWLPERKKGGQRLNCAASTAFDVVESVSDSIRYGFLSDFDTKDGASDADLDFLLRCHINMLQFYDWSFRHDKLVSTETIYEDMMGKRKDFSVIRGKIKGAHERGMKPIGYGAVYAASKAYAQAHPEQVLYTFEGEAFRFIDIFYLMNIEESNGWHEHILEEYVSAAEQAGFDGIHMDTYGFPKEAFSQKGEKILLQEEFPGLIRDARIYLERKGKDCYLIFNNVGNWPVNTVACAPQDAVYIEVWPPYEKYHHIREIIREAKAACGGKKQVILAAYLEPFRLEEKGELSEGMAGYAARLLTAAVVSMGATHLLMGEEGCALTQGYYPDYTRMQEPLKEQMIKYYDFLIRYMNLFYSEDMQEVSMTHMGWDNYEYQCHFPWSGDGAAGRIWTIIRQSERAKSISLINLCGCSDDYWNRGKERPQVQRELEFTVLTDGDVEGIYLATPDKEAQDAVGFQSDIASYEGMNSLQYDYFLTNKGRFVKFTVPWLFVWAMVFIRMK